nr:hypothetical protein [Tanacetum cinerariifolium]
MEEEENRAIASINKTPALKAAKKRRLNEEADDVEELKQHLEIVPDEDDDVYTEATPLARKVVVPSTRRRRRVLIRDPEEELSVKTPTETKSKDKDKGKGIMVEEPKPIKKKQQVKLDEAYARK